MQNFSWIINALPQRWQKFSIDKFMKAGFKPFLLAALVYCWLMGGGYLLVKFALPTVK